MLSSLYKVNAQIPVSRFGAAHGLFCLAAIFLTAQTAFGFGGGRETEKRARICPHITLIGEVDPGLTATETRLVCGDLKIKGTELEKKLGLAWVEIPHWQSKFHLKTFLQDRALYHPRFKQEGDRVLIDLGVPTRVSSIRAEGAPEGLHLERRREVVGEKLTPLLLSQVEGWVYQRLQALGYACPVVKSKADPDTGEVLVNIEPGKVMAFHSVEEEPMKSIEPGMLRRYDAFQLGERFNGDFVTITERRVQSQGMVQNIHFNVSCGPDGAVVHQSVIEGAPRLLTFGFGANTEGLLLAKASWRNTRLGRSASMLDLTAQASSIIQQLDASMAWFILPEPSRKYLRPTLNIRHENVEPFEVITGGAQFGPATSWDGGDYGLAFRVGPALDLIRTIRGSSGEGNSHFLSLDAELRLLTHDFEFYRGSPRTGYSLTLNTNLNSRKLLSEVSAQRMSLQGEALWNYHKFDPPTWVLGTRWGAATTVTPERPGPESLLPPPLLQFLGGSLDLRGFGRRILPRDGAGRLSSVFAGFELRQASVLPYHLQPFAFLDLGALGSRAFALDPQLYWSPGVGMRWESPVGVARVTLAHGYVNGSGLTAQERDELSHFQLYFSFGEEF